MRLMVTVVLQLIRLPLRILDFVDGPDSLPPKGTTASDAFPESLSSLMRVKDTDESSHQYLAATGV